MADSQCLCNNVALCKSSGLYYLFFCLFLLSDKEKEEEAKAAAEAEKAKIKTLLEEINKLEQKRQTLTQAKRVANADKAIATKKAELEALGYKAPAKKQVFITKAISQQEHLQKQDKTHPTPELNRLLHLYLQQSEQWPYQPYKQFEPQFLVL